MCIVLYYNLDRHRVLQELDAYIGGDDKKGKPSPKDKDFFFVWVVVERWGEQRALKQNLA